MLSASTSPACARTLASRARTTTRSRDTTPSARRTTARRVLTANTSQDDATSSSSSTSRRGLLFGTIGIAALALSGPPVARAADAPRVVGAAVSAPNKFWLANGCYWGRQVGARSRLFRRRVAFCSLYRCAFVTDCEIVARDRWYVYTAHVL